MGIFDWLKKPEPTQIKKFTPTSHSGYRPIFTLSYDGEKNMGELGAPVKYTLEHDALRIRSWKSYLDNEITQTVVKKYVKWIIGSGLKLQSEPVESVLQTERTSR